MPVTWTSPGNSSTARPGSGRADDPTLWLIRERGAMPNQPPRATLDARYSEETAQATPWPEAVALLEQAGLFWVSTVRTDGRPHVTPVVAVWMSGALYFSSGPGEQKS